ncbi:ComEA family DNA-binding protein [Microbacterium hydrocarbonoxydans]|uniref:Competence protein ComEA n=1 Tax=Microbacterium hydrocarbonoxydans TaxID=273678 RepID=A0A1H4L933_9MICO|nr:ComEA family DNA-binding protein [Microbacterium hydrocarbonoxydans]SEB67231.1 competence protein ComEA [Microbacterium hydrocarbonoxydans]
MPDALTEAPRPRRFRLGLGAAIVLALVVLSAAVGLGLLRGQAPPSDSVPLPTAGSASAGAAGELYVHVLGAVEHPGLYVLDLDSRLVDAVAAAGGTTADADLSAINLARVLADGEQILVPVVGVAAEEGAPQPADDLIDLNSADQAALETLPRIGPALAERIIAWREENGRFQSVDDLLGVPGIGEKMLAGIRDGVRV